ncbi:signal transduction histidine kinase [Lentzea flaviverrucosa]|uniref:histidine kinase n=1 Tax=Lentzea flaviverrucosa TaxID=200379 RepID=A0A1H9VIQ5_9PSEU|nr:signal transduction histidine kinase [Lentzea flaviverrucosa]SES21448.1 Signal transduction histidine kinase [Lentzea flaviverrucosa]
MPGAGRVSTVANVHQVERLGAGSLVRGWFRMLVGLTIGSLTGVAGLAAAAAGVGVVGLTEYELGRITRFDRAVHTNPLTRQGCRRYLAVRWLVGALGAGVICLLAFWYAIGISMVTAWLFDGDWALVEDADRVTLGLLALVAIPGALVIFVTTAGVVGVAVLDRWLATAMLGTSQQTLLRERVAELKSTRAEVIEAIDDERRRIERDLHDGVQQRLVALGMLIGRAKRARGEEQLQELLRQAHDTAGEAIDELREVATRVYPAVLDDAGLDAALEVLAERSSVRVEISNRLGSSPGTALETVIYFVTSEAVNNAAKHADPSLVEIHVRPDGEGGIAVLVRDDGIGGADPTGTGLSGLARRVKAVDGDFEVTSPPGGPTTIYARVPCE